MPARSAAAAQGVDRLPALLVAALGLIGACGGDPSPSSPEGQCRGACDRKKLCHPSQFESEWPGFAGIQDCVETCTSRLTERLRAAGKCVDLYQAALDCEAALSCEEARTDVPGIPGSRCEPPRAAFLKCDPALGVVHPSDLIVFRRSSGSEPGDLFTIRPDGSGLAQLTATPTIDERDPSWSTDFQRIAYIDAKGFHHLPATGGAVVDLATVPGLRNPRWHHTDTVIAAEDALDELANRLPNVFNSHYTRFGAETDANHLLGIGWAGAPSQFVYAAAFSPIDGTAALLSWQPPGAGLGASSKLCIVAYDGSETVRGCDGHVAKPMSDLDPTLHDVRWARTGAAVAFVEERDDHGHDVWIQTVTPNPKAAPVTQSMGDCRGPTFSPDGHSLVFSSNAGGSYDLYLLDLDKGTFTRLTNTPDTDETAPDWG